jgi:hypothetical protein
MPVVSSKAGEVTLRGRPGRPPDFLLAKEKTEVGSCASKGAVVKRTSRGPAIQAVLTVARAIQVGKVTAGFRRRRGHRGSSEL